ncbi:MAG: hypothetical protein ACRELB_24990, partial [Polyangiaceae bacterium]
MRRSTDALVRETMGRCLAPGAELGDLYALSQLVMDLVSKGRADTALSSTVAKAINLAIADADRASHVGTLVVRRAAHRLPLAMRGRPTLLEFERAPLDGEERDLTIGLPKAQPEGEPSEEIAAAFFAPRPDARVHPEASGKHVELAGDSTRRPRRELHTEVVVACAENVAMLARHRDERPAWERPENEQALLFNVEAIGASGGQCARIIVDWWSKSDDPWKTWAAVFTLACFPEADVLEAILRGLEELPADATHHAPAAAEALLVAPHPHVPELAKDLCASPNPIARAVGIEFLGRRKLLTPQEVRHHGRDANVAVLAAAIASAGVLPPNWAPTFLEPYLRCPEPVVAWRAAQQLTHLHQVAPYYYLRRDECAALGSKALEVLVQFGDASDLERFEGIVARGPATVEVLSATARFGEPSTWAFLVHHLADPELADAAARALLTLFGPIVSKRYTR